MAVHKRLTTNSETQEVDKIPNAIAHAVWGAIEAAAAKGNATEGAIAGASSELAAPLIAKALYGTDDPKQLTEVQKQNIINLSSLAGAIGAGIANGNGGGTEVLTSANQGAEIGKRAVENNTLLNKYSESLLNQEEKALFEKLKANGIEFVDEYQNEFNKAQTQEERDRIIAAYKSATERGNKVLLDMYKQGKLTDSDYELLFTFYADKMLKGAQLGQIKNNSKHSGGFLETDPYGFYGTEWFIGSQFADPYLNELEEHYLNHQVKLGNITKSDKDNRLTKRKILENEFNSGGPDSLRNLVNDPTSVFAGIVAGKAINKLTKSSHLNIGDKIPTSGNKVLGIKYESTNSSSDYIIEGTKPSTKGMLIKPQYYENPGHHDPKGNNKVGYNRTKSVLPENHIDLWGKSFLGSDGNRWAVDYQKGKVIYHRFQNDGNGNFHWNGSTSGKTVDGIDRNIDIRHVPKDITNK